LQTLYAVPCKALDVALNKINTIIIIILHNYIPAALAQRFEFNPV